MTLTKGVPEPESTNVGNRPVQGPITQSHRQPNQRCRDLILTKTGESNSNTYQWVPHVLYLLIRPGFSG